LFLDDAFSTLYLPTAVVSAVFLIFAKAETLWKHYLDTSFGAVSLACLTYGFDFNGKYATKQV